MLYGINNIYNGSFFFTCFDVSFLFLFSGKKEILTVVSEISWDVSLNSKLSVSENVIPETSNDNLVPQRDFKLPKTEPVQHLFILLNMCNDNLLCSLLKLYNCWRFCLMLFTCIILSFRNILDIPWLSTNHLHRRSLFSFFS